MGVFYHLRYPLLVLDLLARRTRRLTIFHTLTMPGDAVYEDTQDHPTEEREPLPDPGWPKIAFIERRFSRDPANWGAANHAGVEAMLRSAGRGVIARPAGENWLCKPDPEDRPERWHTDARLKSLPGAIGGMVDTDSRA